MNIGIVGTRGIPNEYGGFEQFAEYLAVGLVKNGHKVVVYSPHNHSFQNPKYKGVDIIHKYDPEYRIGTIGQFIYDFNCIWDSRKRDFDIILQLGYTSSSIWSKLFPPKALIFTNMDGLEWKRSKFSNSVKKFLKFAEKLAVNNSHFLVADSPVIKDYIYDTYEVNSKYIAYGTILPVDFKVDILDKYKVKAFKYDILVARLEPENHIGMIVEGAYKSKSERVLLVVGNLTTSYGKELKEKYSSDKIRFIGGVYNLDELNSIRHYSNLYFHGHSVGGTNPSLLEAMACKTLICAHYNDFNSEVLLENAYYFSSSDDVAHKIDTVVKSDNEEKVENNLKRINNQYTWPSIINEYENFFLEKL